MTVGRRFQVVFEPDDGGWHAYVPSVRGCRTWGRSLVAARKYVREALATCVDVLGENAERIARAAVLEEKIRLDSDTKKAVVEYFAVRDRAVKLQDLAQVRVREAAKKLTKHLSLRDAGELLGLSHERVSQVMTKEPQLFKKSAPAGRLASKDMKQAKHAKGAA